MDLGRVAAGVFPTRSSVAEAPMLPRFTSGSSWLQVVSGTPLRIRTAHQFVKPVLSRGITTTRPLATSASSQTTFTWDDALRLGAAGDDGEVIDLRGYFDKVRNCNRGHDMQSEFVPFKGDGRLLGYLHKGFLDHLVKFDDVFELVSEGRKSYVSLNQSLRSPDDRTGAVGVVIRRLGVLIPGIRNELYPVTPAFGMPPYFSLERAAAPYFGIKAYGVHMNGFVEKDGKKYLWIGKRSDTKPHFSRDARPSCSRGDDGEVDSFQLIPVSQVANIVRRTEFFKPNCSLVIMDFLFRHGYMNPDAPGYLELVQSLRSGECS